MCSDLDSGTKYVDIKHNGQWKIAENKVHTFFGNLVHMQAVPFKKQA